MLLLAARGATVAASVDGIGRWGGGILCRVGGDGVASFIIRHIAPGGVGGLPNVKLGVDSLSSLQKEEKNYLKSSKNKKLEKFY